MGTAWANHGQNHPPETKQAPSKGCLTCGYTEDGIRTRDPHLGKVRRSVGLRPLVPLSSVFPVDSSADSAESARFREPWFNALNEPGFADSPPDDRDPAEADSPSNLVRRPARTTETSSRPPSALTYASSTSIVTFRDFSIATIRGCETDRKSVV